MKLKLILIFALGLGALTSTTETPAAARGGYLVR